MQGIKLSRYQTMTAALASSTTRQRQHVVLELCATLGVIRTGQRAVLLAPSVVRPYYHARIARILNVCAERALLGFIRFQVARVRRALAAHSGRTVLIHVFHGRPALRVCK